MENVKIKKANLGDEKTLAFIQTESWKSAFSTILSTGDLLKYTNIDKAEEMYKNILSNNSCDVAIEYIDDKPHCIAAWGKNRDGLDGDIAELICIHSLPNRWHMGYGSAMIEFCLEEISKDGYTSVMLWVFEKNISARKFYEKHDFNVTNRRKESFNSVEIMYIKEL